MLLAAGSTGLLLELLIPGGRPFGAAFRRRTPNEGYQLKTLLEERSDWKSKWMFTPEHREKLRRLQRIGRGYRAIGWLVAITLAGAVGRFAWQRLK